MAAAVALAALAAGGSVAAAATTLGDLVPKEDAASAKAAGLPLDAPIGSFARLEDAGGVVIAGALGAAGAPIEEVAVFAFDATDGRWRQRRISEPPLGSVVRVARLGDLLTVELHLTPSAASTRVLDRALAERARLAGWRVGTLGEGVALFERSRPHFGPISETALFLYDSASGATRDLVPGTLPDPPRRALERRAAATYRELGDDWCRTRNDPCDPRRLASSLREGRVLFDEAHETLCFALDYRLPPEGVTTTVLYRLRGAESPEPALEARELAPKQAPLETLCAASLAE